MDPQELVLVALRASALYFIILLVVRLMGKRTVGNLSAFDLLVTLMIGEVVDEIIYGDVNMVKGLLVIAVIALWQFVNSVASYRSKAIRKLTEASPTILVDRGELLKPAMAMERVSIDEIESQLRLQGIDNIEEVKTGTLEPHGQISFVKEEWAKEVQKSDIEQPKKRASKKKRS